MTVTSWTPGEVFTVRVYKNLSNRQDIVWSNTYEVQAIDASAEGIADANAVADIIVDWEQQFHLNDVQFNRAVFSTWVADGEPYNPASFITIPYDTRIGGASAGVAERLPLQMCLFLRRTAQTGRAGRALYRRCLTEADVNSPSGDPVLTSEGRALLVDRVGTGVDNLAGRLVNSPASLVMSASTGISLVPISRQVTAMEVAGVAVRKYNNRYYDRV